jgi:predicted ATPase
LATTEERSGGRKKGVEPPGKPAAANGTFAVRGEYWTLGCGGTTFPLKDIKGLSYIQRLLQHPGEEFHSLDLLSGPGSMNRAASKHKHAAQPEGTDSVGGLGDSGEMLDAQAKQEYKRKLLELNEQLEDQNERGNHERAEQIGAEIDFLNREIARAVGLGGRDRRAGSASERARLNVTRAIKAALQKISEQQASMGELLDRSIRTGSFCCYTPDPRNCVTWQFSEGGPEALGGVDSEDPFISPRETSLLRALSERTAFVGREAERAMLRHFLNRTLSGEGRVVMISGAAGVGKTRIAQEFGIEASQKGFLVRTGGCYDRGDSVPFIPFVEILEQALAQAPSPQAFREALGNDAPEIARLLPQLRRLFPDIPPPLEIPPEQSRRLLFHAGAEFLARTARSRPVVLLFDDLQWADEGTSSLLSYLAPLVAKMPVLIVGTYRDSEFDPTRPLAKTLDELIRLHVVERISLGGLPQNAVAGMLRALSGREPPKKLVSLIYSETEGNPFFVEELFHHLVEQGKLIDSFGEFRLDLKIEDVDVPRSLRLVIGRRVARVSGETQKVLGAAAVIGRSFTFELLEASTRIGPDRLLDQVEEAEKAGLIYSSLDYPDARFQFSHELIRQAVISELSAARRQRLHLDVADAIERIYSATLEDHAEDLAHHLWQAGVAADANRTVQYLAMAARQAMTRSANLEAISHLTKGLELLQGAPQTPKNLQQELMLQASLGMALIFAKGYSAPDVQRVYERAHELCKQLGSPPQLSPVLWGLWAYYLVRSQFKNSTEIGQQLLNLAEQQNDTDLLLEAHASHSMSTFYVGNFATARVHCEKAIEIYDVEKHHGHALVYGQDPAVGSLTFLAWTLWIQGYPDQALTKCGELLKHARQLAHSHTLAYALACAATFHQFCRNVKTAKELAEEGIAFSSAHGFPVWSLAANYTLGWALSQLNDLEASVVLLRDATEAWRTLGAQSTRPHQLGLLADALGRSGRPEEGLSVLDQALAEVRTTNEEYYEAELHRLRGELLLRHSQRDEDRAEAAFLQSLDVAQRQSAKSWELRAASSLFRLKLQRRGDGQARLSLAKVYGSFTEGFETQDLKDARTLLEQSRAV